MQTKAYLFLYCSFFIAKLVLKEKILFSWAGIGGSLASIGTNLDAEKISGNFLVILLKLNGGLILLWRSFQRAVEPGEMTLHFQAL